MKKISTVRTIFSACLLIVLIVAGGCSKKIVNTNSEVSVRIAIDAKVLAPEALNFVDHFELTVEGDDFGAIEVIMVPEGNFIVAEVVVPSGPARRFVARAYDKDGILLYEGEAISDVGKDTTIELNIDLLPVVPMLNITPHYQYVIMNDSFYVDISIFNVPNISEITLDFNISDSPTDILSITKGTAYGDTVTLWYESGYQNAAIGVYYNQDAVGTIVDESGYAHLARVWFRSYRDWGSDTATAFLQVLPTYIYSSVIGDTISSASVFTDGAEVELFNPDTLVVGTWEKAFGGAGDESGQCICPSHDGAFIIAGSTTSYGSGSNDVYLTKVDELGTQIWQYTYGGYADDIGNSVIATSDGGYVIAGSSSSYSSDGLDDVYLVKTTGAGIMEWQKTYTNVFSEMGFSVKETGDGGFIVAGASMAAGGSLVYLVKTNNMGDSVWANTYGAGNFNGGWSVTIDPSGNYVIAGSTASLYESDDVLMVFVDTLGEQILQVVHGGIGEDDGRQISPAIDGGFIIVGNSSTWGNGMNDVYAIKTNSLGSHVWSKTYGFAGNDYGYSIAPTRDQGFIIAGCTAPVGGQVNDLYLIKTMANGSPDWFKTYGGEGNEIGYSVLALVDGGYIIVGETSSFGAGGRDIYILKTDANGNIAPEMFL